MINSEKIKIMLTREDIKKYDIRMYSLGHTGSAIKEAFSEVLSDIKNKTGFDTLSKKTVLQVYPSRDGGCEVYLTRLNSDGGDKLHSDRPTDFNKQTDTPITIRRWLETVIFAFGRITDVIDACRTLDLGQYSKTSSLHVCSGVYYLFLEAEIRSKSDDLIKLSDFAKRVDNRLAQAYITEHGECIIKSGAIEALSR